MLFIPRSVQVQVHFAKHTADSLGLAARRRVGPWAPHVRPVVDLTPPDTPALPALLCGGRTTDRPHVAV